MANESARGLVLPVSILAAVAVGVLIGATLARPSASSPTVMRSDEHSPELLPALRALTTELERMRQSAAGLSTPAPQSTRNEAGPNGGVETARQIEEASKRLTAALEQMRTMAASISAERKPLIAPTTAPDLPFLGKLTSADHDAVLPKYLLWTYQQVMERFGAPTSVHRLDNGMQWMYRVSEDNEISFVFSDGRVYEMIL